MYAFYELARNEKGYKDIDVCRKTGISPGAMSDWKTGRTKDLSLDKLKKIADLLDVTVDFFVTGKKEHTFAANSTFSNIAKNPTAYYVADTMATFSESQLERLAAYVRLISKENEMEEPK